MGKHAAANQREEDLLLLERALELEKLAIEGL